jgi:hypothetical protein
MAEWLGSKSPLILLMFINMSTNKYIRLQGDTFSDMEEPVALI